jgi:hypothetical protein
MQAPWKGEDIASPRSVEGRAKREVEVVAVRTDSSLPRTMAIREERADLHQQGEKTCRVSSALRCKVVLRGGSVGSRAEPMKCPAAPKEDAILARTKTVRCTKYACASP